MVVPSRHGEGVEEKKYKSEEAEEVREILSAVSEFISSLRGPIKDLIDTLVSALNGKKLGEEVASFYKGLKEHGLPDDLVNEMTREFFHKKLESAPSISGFMDALKNMFTGRGPRAFVAVSGPKDVEEAVRVLEEVKEVSPEKREKIERAIRVLKALRREERRKEEREEGEDKHVSLSIGLDVKKGEEEEESGEEEA